MSRIARSVVGWRVRQPLDRGLGFGHVTVGAAIEQCLHQNTGRGNAPPQQPSLAEQMVDGGAHERYGLIAISTPSPAHAAKYTLTSGKSARRCPWRTKTSPTSARSSLSAVTLRIRVAVRQRHAQRHPGAGHREVITGSFGNPQGLLDLAHHGIVGPQHAMRYSARSR